MSETQSEAWFAEWNTYSMEHGMFLPYYAFLVHVPTAEQTWSIQIVRQGGYTLKGWLPFDSQVTFGTTRDAMMQEVKKTGINPDIVEWKTPEEAKRSYQFVPASKELVQSIEKLAQAQREGKLK